MSRYTFITDPDGNTIKPYQTDTAYLEKLDRRNPLYKYYKYRFEIYGANLPSKFIDWMVKNFSTCIDYGVAKHRVKYGENLDNVPWAMHIDNKSYYKKTYIYFNQDCEVLIRLTFIKGTTV